MLTYKEKLLLRIKNPIGLIKLLEFGKATLKYLKPSITSKS